MPENQNVLLMPTRMVGSLQHRRKDRVNEDLLVTNQYGHALAVDSDYARAVQTKWNAVVAERMPHTYRHGNPLVEGG